MSAQAAAIRAMRDGWSTIQVPCASINHLMPETVAAFRESPSWMTTFLYAVHDNGIFLTVPAMHWRAGLSQDLLDIFAAADKIQPLHGWIMLDVDGDELPGVPTYPRS